MTNSGDNKSVNDRLIEFESILNEYKFSIGTGFINYNNDIKEALQLDLPTIKMLNRDECEEYAIALSNYSAFLNMEYNRQCVRFRWAERELGLLIAGRAEAYGGKDFKFMKYEVLRGKVILNDAAARALNNIIIHAEARKLELENMSSKIDFIQRALKDYGRNKS